MSRSAAKNSITSKMVRQELERAGVELIGGGIDEAPYGVKDIQQVMTGQSDLVEVLGEFYSEDCRMCGDNSPSED